MGQSLCWCSLCTSVRVEGYGIGVFLSVVVVCSMGGFLSVCGGRELPRFLAEAGKYGQAVRCSMITVGLFNRTSAN